MQTPRSSPTIVPQQCDPIRISVSAEKCESIISESRLPKDRDHPFYLNEFIYRDLRRDILHQDLRNYTGRTLTRTSHGCDEKLAENIKIESIICEQSIRSLDHGLLPEEIEVIIIHADNICRNIAENEKTKWLPMSFVNMIHYIVMNADLNEDEKWGKLEVVRKYWMESTGMTDKTRQSLAIFQEVHPDIFKIDLPCELHQYVQEHQEHQENQNMMKREPEDWCQY